MEKVFIVQKRPAHGVSNGFYYRIVDVRTGEAVNQNFLHSVQAEAHCQHLNDEVFRLAKPVISSTTGIPSADSSTP